MTRIHAAVIALAWCSGLLLAAPAAAQPSADAPGGLSAEAEVMRKRHVAEAEKKLQRQTLAARRALNSMCADCGTRPKRTGTPRAAPARPLRPEEAPDHEWVPPVDD